MDKNVQEFIEGKRIAVLGASHSGKKFGNNAFPLCFRKDENYDKQI